MPSNKKAMVFYEFSCLKMLNFFKNRRFYNFELFSIENTTKNLDFKKRIAYI